MCAAAWPKPWYPRVYAQSAGIPQEQLYYYLEDLWLDGLVQKAEGSPETGPGLTLTEAGRDVLDDPAALQRLKEGRAVKPGDQGGAVREAYPPADPADRHAWGDRRERGGFPLHRVPGFAPGDRVGFHRAVAVRRSKPGRRSTRPERHRPGGRRLRRRLAQRRVVAAAHLLLHSHRRPAHPRQHVRAVPRGRGGRADVGLGGATWSSTSSPASAAAAWRWGWSRATSWLAPRAPFAASSGRRRCGCCATADTCRDRWPASCAAT